MTTRLDSSTVPTFIVEMKEKEGTPMITIQDSPIEATTIIYEENEDANT